MHSRPGPAARPAQPPLACSPRIARRYRSHSPRIRWVISELHTRIGPTLIESALDRARRKRFGGMDDGAAHFERTRADPGEPYLGHDLGASSPTPSRRQREDSTVIRGEPESRDGRRFSQAGFTVALDPSIRLLSNASHPCSSEMRRSGTAQLMILSSCAANYIRSPNLWHLPAESVNPQREDLHDMTGPGSIQGRAS